MHFDIIIVGAGLAGASLAAAFKGSRYRIALVEGRVPAPAPSGWDSRVYAVSPAAQGFSARDRRLAASRWRPPHARPRHGHTRRCRWPPGFLGLRQRRIDQLAWIVESGLMQRELWETAKRQGNITLFCPAQPQSLTLRADAVSLGLTSGETLEAQLVVGADGADSWVRAQAGLQADTLLYGEMGVVANFECEQPHHNTAFQWFRPDGVLAWLPLPGVRISAVWSTPDAHAHELLDLDEEALCRRIAAAGANRLGALRLITPPTAFPLRLMRVPRIVAPRLALVGDAAHAIHPLSGHGINLGFLDARELAHTLLDLPAHRDCGDELALRRYGRARAERGRPATMDHAWPAKAVPAAAPGPCRRSQPGIEPHRQFGCRTQHAGALRARLTPPPRRHHVEEPHYAHPCRPAARWRRRSCRRRQGQTGGRSRDRRKTRRRAQDQHPRALYEVVVGGEILYTDEKVNYLITGNIIDTKSRQNLTQERLNKLSAIKFADLPLELAVKTVKGDGKRVFATFEDPNCGYCKKLAKEMAGMTNVTVHTFLLPILSRDSAEKSKAVWCAADRAKAWSDLMVNGIVPAAGTCDAPIEKVLALAQKHNIRGTPTIFPHQRRAHPRRHPLAQLEQKLAQAAK
ncbi:MAG: thioredoxin fold domain-containing protein [Rhodocyclaceae bacterium]|nr:thioredoxin fold domain-containing protein [Rhodocyclaceae bacterium]